MSAMARRRPNGGWPLGPGWCYAAVSRLLAALKIGLQDARVNCRSGIDSSVETSLLKVPLFGKAPRELAAVRGIDCRQFLTCLKQARELIGDLLNLRPSLIHLGCSLLDEVCLPYVDPPPDIR